MAEGEYLTTLKEDDQWVAWEYRCRNNDCGTTKLDADANECPECGDDPTKPPLSPVTSHGYAQSDDESTWVSYERTREYAREQDMEGVGFMLSGGIRVGVDLDGCRDPETGELEDWAEDIVDRLDTYTEVSPSGTGLRAFVIGRLPEGRRRQGQERTIDALEGVNKTPEVEMYQQTRYMTYTGNKLEGTPNDVQERADEIEAIHSEYVAEDDENGDLSDFEGSDTDDDLSGETPENAANDLSDEEIIEIAKNAENGRKFERLWRGDTSVCTDDSGDPDHSRADLALCSLLAFYTGGDRSRIERLFEKSGLVRDKWRNRSDYRKRTINKALSDMTEFYEPSGDDSRPDKIDCECGRTAYKSETRPVEDDETLEAMGVDSACRCDYWCAECGRKGTVTFLDGERERTEWETPEDREPTTDGDESGESSGGPSGRSSGYTPSWDMVRAAYEDHGDGVGRQKAARALEGERSFMYVLESKTLWVYDGDTGYFNKWGEEVVGNILERELGPVFSTTEKHEIVARLESKNQTHREDLNARTRNDNLVCVGNGVLNVKTGELMDHSPEFKFTRGVPHDYSPDAVPERTLWFLRDVTQRNADMWTLLQQLGHGLLPGHPFKAFVVMYGPGDNGKSAVGRLFRQFVGDENAASVELRDFREDDFATGDLPGKMINVGDDLSGKKVRDVSMLKRLTGGDTLRANEKHKATFDFQNEAAMFFSGNEPPVFAEKTAALKGRLYPIRMPFRFTQEQGDGHKDADPHLVDRIAEDDEEMSGLLNLAVQGAQDLIETGGDFAMPESPDERMEKYEAASDPIRQFVMDCLEQGESGDRALKEDVFDVYTSMCRAEGRRAAAEDVFKREISQQAIVDVESGRTRALTDDDDRNRCWKYLRFAPEATEHMPDRLQQRYFDGDVPDRSDESDATESDDESADAPHNAVWVQDAAEDPTGYATVTVEVTAVEYPENGPHKRLKVKDESSAVEVIAWDEDDADVLFGVEQGDHVVIKNAEVGEFDGKAQLVVDGALTEVAPIQAGVGHAPGVAPEPGQTSVGVASDGSGDLEGVKARVHQTVVNCSGGDEVTVSRVASKLATDYAPETVRDALETLAREGIVKTTDNDDTYEVL
jgi:putative DNA primase/helicase